MNKINQRIEELEKTLGKLSLEGFFYFLSLIEIENPIITANEDGIIHVTLKENNNKLIIKFIDNETVKYLLFRTIKGKKRQISTETMNIYEFAIHIKKLLN